MEGMWNLVAEETKMEFSIDRKYQALEIREEYRMALASLLRNALIDSFDGHEEADVQHEDGDIEKYRIPPVEQLLEHATFTNTGNKVRHTDINIVNAHVRIPAQHSGKYMSLNLTFRASMSD